ncbi:glycosyltransferase family 4 protein [Pluralibacter gergoviae]
MKIVYFVNEAWYFDLHWLDRADAAIQRGYEVHLVSCFRDEKIKTKLIKAGITCWDIKLERFSKNIFKNISIFIGFKRVCKSINPDIIHLITIKPVIFGGIYARLFRIPYVVSFVGLGRVFGKHNGFLDKIIKHVILILYRFILSPRSSAQIVFEHEEDYRTLQKNIDFNAQSIHVIEGAGVDRKLFTYRPESKNHPFVVLFASRMLWAKGLGQVVEAIKILNDKDIILKVAGIIDKDDPDRIELEQIHEWERNGDIVWLGRRNDVQNIISESNLVILPTIYSEGVPRIIIEACAVGRCCVVGNVAGCKAIIKDNVNGSVLRINTAEEIADKIKYLKEHDEIRKLYGLRSAKIVEERFSKDIVIDKTFHLYNNVLKIKSDS